MSGMQRGVAARSRGPVPTQLRLANGNVRDRAHGARGLIARRGFSRLRVVFWGVGSGLVLRKCGASSAASALPRLPCRAVSAAPLGNDGAIERHRGATRVDTMLART
jgi:hypothetical protein